MGLVQTRDGRRRFVPAGEDPRPESDGQLLLVRNRALTLPLDVYLEERELPEEKLPEESLDHE